MAKTLFHYTCCFIVFTILCGQGDGLGRDSEEVKIEKIIVNKLSKMSAEEQYKLKKERIDDIVREMDLLKGMAEMVDHHIDDFYEEFPRERNKKHKILRYLITTGYRQKTTGHRPKTTKHWHKSTRKLLREGYNSDYNNKINDKEKKAYFEQKFSDDVFKFNNKTEKTTTASPNELFAIEKKHKIDDFNLHKNTKTTEDTTTESQNKYASKQKHRDDDFNLHKNTKSTEDTTTESQNKYASKQKYEYDDNDFNLHRNIKITEESTIESLNKHHAKKMKYEDDDFNFHRNTKTTQENIIESPNKNHLIKSKYEDDDFNFHKYTKTTEENKIESPNKHHVKKPKYEDNDFTFHKNIKTTEESQTESSNKYHSKISKYEDDDFNFHKYTKTTEETTTESLNKHHANKQKYRSDDFNFHENNKNTEETTTDYPNKHYAKKQKHEEQNPYKVSDSEDDTKSRKYTKPTETRITHEPRNGHYSKGHDREEKYSRTYDEIGSRIYTTETTTESWKRYHSNAHENNQLHKQLIIDNERKSLQFSETTESKTPTTPLKKYSKKDEVYKSYFQEIYNSDENVLKTSKLPETSESEPTGEVQFGKFRVIEASEKYIPKIHKDSSNKKILHYYRALDEGLKIHQSQPSGADSVELSNELSKNNIDLHKTETETPTHKPKTNWPTFTHMLEEIGKKYDWKNDRWIKLRRNANTQVTKKDDVDNFQEKHKFSYSTIKLNSTNSSRNVVIAVTAVR